MYYVYVLRSLKDKKLYSGYYSDFKQRFTDHNLGKVAITKYRIPFELIKLLG